MYKYVVFTTSVVILYVCNINGVFCTKSNNKIAALDFWKRDKKYDADFKHEFRRKFGYEKIHRLHSDQRKWERDQMAKYKIMFRNIVRSPTHQLSNALRAFPNVKIEAVERSNDIHGQLKSANATRLRIRPQTYRERKPSTRTDKSYPRAIMPMQFLDVNNKIKKRNYKDKPKKGGRQDDSDTQTTTASDVEDSEEATDAPKITNEKEIPNDSTASALDEKKEIAVLNPYNLRNDLEEYFVDKFPGVNITMEIIGRTVEYNDIIMIKATNTVSTTNRTYAFRAKYEDDYDEKKIVFIVHGLHVMGFNQLPCMRQIDSMTKLFSFYFKHLDKYDIFIIPMANPDGVSASAVKPFWNKNLSPQEACPGVALDRNFDISWTDSTRKISSCSQQYPGETPFSEAETQAIKEVFHRYGHKMAAYLNVHAGSYSPSIFKGDAVLYPNGFTERSTDEDKYIDLKAELEEMLRNVSFRVYNVNMKTLYNWYGKVRGTSIDYAAVVYGIPYAMEFAMQLYEDDLRVDKSEERETNSALTEVWSRVIDLVFNFMHHRTKTEQKK